MSEAIPKKRRWRIRFTVRTLLLAAALVGLLLANVASYFRAQQAEADASLRMRRYQEEMTKLRHFAGFPNDPDGTRVQVVAIPLPHAQAWAWRVFVPYGGRFELRFQWNDVPQHDFPEGTAFDTGEPWILEPGLTTVFVEVRESQDRKGDVAVTVGSDDVNDQRVLRAPEGRPAWVDMGRVKREVTGEIDTENFFPGDEISLLRLRDPGGETPEVAPDMSGGPYGNKHEAVEGNPLAPGFMLWLRQVRSPRD